MAFIKTKVEGFQTSTNVAAELTAALVAQGAVEANAKAVVATVREIRDELFTDISAVIDADNVALKAEAATSPAVNTGGGGGGNRRASSADSGGGTGKVFTKEEGAALVLNFGAFKGLSIGSVIAMPASEAGTYGYPKAAPGSKPGKSYIEWLSTDEEPARNFASRAAKAALS